MLHIVTNIGKNYISYDFVACKPVHLDVAGLNCLHHEDYITVNTVPWADIIISNKLQDLVIL